MMTAALAHEGIDATYTALEISADEWDERLAALHEAGVQGLNVTIPHKERALATGSVVSPAASAIGAANTLTRHADGWSADNTDGPGFLDWIDALGARAAAERGALVLGAGGAARAVVWALREIGCRGIRVANRTLARARSLEGASVEPWGASAPEGGIVIQCTSVGLSPTDPSPIEPERLAGVAFGLDLVYPETAFVRAARAAGASAADGVGLLVAQGARSFHVWTGRSPDRALMERVIRSEIERRKS
jgi:shikimate dehydrogenase